MAGHNKWAQIKHKKAKEDVKRGKLFSRLSREITVAARIGGGDPEGNPRLRSAVLQARAANMPKDNIDQAILRGTGELPGVAYEEVTFEGYGPGDVAILIHALTDNKNRTSSEIRHLFSRHGGKLGKSGCVLWQFDKRSYFLVEKIFPDEQMFEMAVEMGFEEMEFMEDACELLGPPELFAQYQQKLEEAGVPIRHAELGMIPQNPIKIEGKTKEKLLILLEALDDHGDVQNLWTNATFD